MLAAMLMSGLYSTAQAQTSGSPWGVAAVRLDWNPNGGMIAVSDAGSIVTILDAQTRAVINTLPVMPFPVRALRWSDDGTRLAIGGDYSIQVWDNAWNAQQAVLSLALQVPPERNGLHKIAAIDWNDSAHQILTVVLRHVYIWDSQTGQLVRTIEPVSTPLVSAAWSPDGTMLGYATTIGYVSIVSLTTNESSGAVAYNQDAPWAMEWEPDSDNLVVGTNSGTLQAFVFFPRRLGSDVVALRDQYIAIFSVDWHPTLPLVAVGYADGLVEIWNPDTYDLIQRVQEPTGSPVMSVSWNPNGTQLAYAGSNTSPLEIVNVASLIPGTIEINTTTAPGLTLTDAETFLAEGATIGDQLSVRLSAAPSSNVTVTLSAPSDVTLTPSSITFTPANYADWVVVNGSAPEDNTPESLYDAPEVVPITLSAAGDVLYTDVSATVDAAVYDAGVNVVLGELLLPEGGTGSYRVRLTAPPGVKGSGVGAETVTIRVVGYNSRFITPTPTTLTFTRANWRVQQMVSVLAVDDNIDYGVIYNNSMSLSLSSDVSAPLDSRYGGAGTNVTVERVRVRIMDND